MIESSSFIKRVERIAKEAKELPMWGNPPEFPLNAFTDTLKERLNLEDLQISCGDAEWKQMEDLLSGMGNSPIQVCFDISPLGKPLFWIMPFEDISKLTIWAIGKNSEGFSDPELQKGYYRYLLIETLAALDENKGLGDLTLKLSENALPNEECYSIDVSLSHENQTAWGRVICPSSSQKAFKEHFRVSKSLFPSPLSSNIELPLALSIGGIALSYDAIKDAKEGDFLILDSCSYYPESKRGTFTLSLNETPLFQVKLKDEKIKILDFAQYYEEYSMQDTPPPEEPEEIEENPPIMGDEELKIPEEETFEEPSIEEEPPKPMEEIPPQEITPTQNVPLKISVEIAHIKMTMDKLLQLKPGNILELSVRPEQGVDLTLEGKVVARGQLLQVGEVVGVKITEISP